MFYEKTSPQTPSERIASWVLLLALLGTLSALPACIRGKERPQRHDLSGVDDGRGEGSSFDTKGDLHTEKRPPDLLSPDQSLPPDDFSCKKDFWIKKKKNNTQCASRYVMEVEGSLFVNRQVAIAVDAKRRVGIAYNNEVNTDEGQLHLVSFSVGARQIPAPTIDAGSSYERVGIRVAIAPRSTGGFHLAYVTKGPSGDELDYSGWAGSGKPHPEFLSANVGLAGSVDLIEADDGRVHVFYYADLAHHVYTRSRPTTSATAWSTPYTIGAEISSTSVPDAGHIAVALHPSGEPAFAVHFALSLSSAPRFYRYLSSGSWTSKKTLDNMRFSGVAGQSLDLVITPTEQNATYFAIPKGSHTAELRLASWESSNDTPQISVLEQGFPVASDAPEYEAALGVDRWGLLHLALILPSSLGHGGILEYRRQILRGGKKTWITDIVDDDVLSASSASHVALWVEPSGRPHIAYFNGRTGKLMYATRDDR